MAEAQSEIQIIKDKIEKEMLLQKQIDDEMKTVQKQIVEKKRATGTRGTTSKSDSVQLSKQLKILENRLDKANQKFNESIASNKVMREEIDHLRKEKVIFENVYSRLEKQLGAKRKEMAEIIEVANTAYEERDKVQEKLATMISQSDKEQAEFNKEIKAVQDLIDKDD